MSDNTVSIEPIIGHRYTIEVYEDDSKLTKQLKKIRADLGMEPRNRRRVRITEHDVNWDEPKTWTVKKEYFDELIEAYQDELGE